MNYLGIDPTSNAVFVGANPNAGERAHPQPLLTPLVFAKHGETPDWQAARGMQGGPKLVFFEEQYDLLSRLRRGRVFREERCGDRWFVRDPLRQDLGNAAPKMGNRFEMNLNRFQCDRLDALTRGSYPKVYLGDSVHSSRWTIVGVEGAVLGGPVLTLRADSYLGLLPELDHAKVPAAVRIELEARLENVVASVGRVDPGTTIDCCRNALAVVFGFFGGDRTLDLGPSIDAYIKSSGNPAEGIHSWPGRVVARLHSRTKPNEAQKRDTRPIDDGDAQLAVECLAVVLKDVGWAIH